MMWLDEPRINPSLDTEGKEVYFPLIGLGLSTQGHLFFKDTFKALNTHSLCGYLDKTPQMALKWALDRVYEQRGSWVPVVRRSISLESKSGRKSGFGCLSYYFYDRDHKRYAVAAHISRKFAAVEVLWYPGDVGYYADDHIHTGRFFCVTGWSRTRPFLGTKYIEKFVTTRQAVYSNKPSDTWDHPEKILDTSGKEFSVFTQIENYITKKTYPSFYGKSRIQDGIIVNRTQGTFEWR